MAVITKDTLIGDILRMDPESFQLFLDMGMYCLGCPASYGETLEQACMVHAVDADEMVDELNKHFDSIPKEQEQIPKEQEEK